MGHLSLKARCLKQWPVIEQGEFWVLTWAGVAMPVSGSQTSLGN